MIKQRYINTAFWDDYYISQLDPSEKLLFLYLLTNPCTNLLGVYQIPLKKIAVETGFDLEMVKKLMVRFAGDGKVYYELGWVIMKNHIKNQQHLRGPKIEASMQAAFEECPDWLKERLVAKNDTLSIPYRYLGQNWSTKREERRERVKINNTRQEDVTSNMALNAPINEEFGDPQVNQVVTHFEAKIGKMPKPIYQRRAAKTLIQRHGFEKVIGAINAVVACRGEQYSPNISSLTALRDKWIDLETFYKRASNGGNKIAVIN